MSMLVHSVGLHKDRKAQFNLTNHRLATRWIVEGWCAVERRRAMRRNLTLVICQKKRRWQCVEPFDSPCSNSRTPEKPAVHVIVEPGFTHCRYPAFETRLSQTLLGHGFDFLSDFLYLLQCVNTGSTTGSITGTSCFSDQSQA